MPTRPLNPQVGHIYDPNGNDLGVNPANANNYGNSYFRQEQNPDGTINTISEGWGADRSIVDPALRYGYRLDPNTGGWIPPQGVSTDPHGFPIYGAGTRPSAPPLNGLAPTLPTTPPPSYLTGPEQGYDPTLYGNQGNRSTQPLTGALMNASSGGISVAGGTDQYGYPVQAPAQPGQRRMGTRYRNTAPLAESLLR